MHFDIVRPDVYLHSSIRINMVGGNTRLEQAEVTIQTGKFWRKCVVAMDSARKADTQLKQDFKELMATTREVLNTLPGVQAWSGIAAGRNRPGGNT